MTAWIGTSGWSYDHWQPELYPPGLPPGRRLDRYAAVFPTAELNSSFYRWPSAAAFRSWRDRLPDGFRLSVKAPRGLTHARKLYAPEAWLQRIAEGWHELGDKRAVLLVQLPPSLPRDDERLAYFLGAVPDWIRVAVEFRHPSWDSEDIFALLASHGAAYCVMSGANLPCVLRVTADFAYVRMHGPDHDHLYAGSYSEADLAWWADRIREWDLAGRDVYVYFNNDGDAHAVRNARSLRALLAAARTGDLAHPGTVAGPFGNPQLQDAVVAAVDDELSAGNVGGGVRDEEGDDLGHLRRSAWPAQRNTADGGQ
jgi:uncharacterized protein YecE (DUF72 family)